MQASEKIRDFCNSQMIAFSLHVLIKQTLFKKYENYDIKFVHIPLNSIFSNDFTTCNKFHILFKSNEKHEIILNIKNHKLVMLLRHNHCIVIEVH